ncbi:hypothetical protein TNCV_4858451 [Trichonephila clavipes]|nr:hypothetical protein TNCV_4858451 [Trichonephila clavipes]
MHFLTSGTLVSGLLCPKSLYKSVGLTVPLYLILCLEVLVTLSLDQLTRTTPELTPPFVNFHTSPMRKLYSRQILRASALLHGGSSVAQCLNSRRASHETVAMTARLPRFIVESMGKG